MWSSLGYDVTFWANKKHDRTLFSRSLESFFFFFKGESSHTDANNTDQTLTLLWRMRRHRRPPVSEQEAKGSGSQKTRKTRKTKRTRRKSQTKEETGKDKRRRWETERRKPTERNTTADRKNQAKAPAKGTTRQSAAKKSLLTRSLYKLLSLLARFLNEQFKCTWTRQKRSGWRIYWKKATPQK